MVSVMFGVIQIVGIVFLMIAVPVAAVWLLVKLFAGLAWLLGNLGRLVGASFRHVGRFVRGTLVDSLHFVGGVLTAAVILPLALLNVAIGRWSAAGHYGRALEDEILSAGLSLYRVALGHPIRLLGLRAVTEGVEQRIPDLVARAPRGERERRGKKRFAGYQITGTLPAGGSGAKLYLAKPQRDKTAELRAAGHPDPGQVVIKSFALSEGSTLPQIVRESRALESARRLGLVLEHDLTKTSFHYVMPYVPGDDLGAVCQRLHARSGPEGLSNHDLALVMSYVGDLLHTLDRFHAGGLWHKDIKPSNLIVSNNRVHLVDLGLVTPLSSAMTLTTHGTEYFRDPEMVRLAMKGVKVHEVDGVKFDIYSAGAVLHSAIEDSFPAHGSLSRITKRCPDALQWIVRRAMADMGARYPSARDMLHDLRSVLAARDPFALRPADLPSVRGEAPPRRPADAPGARDFAGAAGVAAAQPVAFVAADGGLEGETPRQRRKRLKGIASGVAGRRGSSCRVACGTSTDEAGRRRRTGRGIVCAGGALAALVVIVVTGVELAHEDARSRESHAWQGGSTAVVSLGHDRSHDRDEERWDARTREIARVLQRSDADGRAPRAAGGELYRAAAGVEGGTAGTVLLLDDLGSSGDPAFVASLEEALRDAHFSVLGPNSKGDDAEREIAASAAARAMIGLGDLDDTDTLERLADWVDATDDLDAVLWLAQGPDGEDVRHRIVLADEDAPDAPDAPDDGALAGIAPEAPGAPDAVGDAIR